MKDIKLVAADMDHTLLTEKGELPPQFENYIVELNRLGVAFSIASGRPLYTLTNIFSNLKNEMTFISDNGGAISHKGELIFTSLIDAEKYKKMIAFSESKTEGVGILCGLDSAYISNKHKNHEAFLRTFYSNITFVDDLQDVTVDANKFTIYFPGKKSKEMYDTVFHPQFGSEFSITIGDTIWIDLMNKNVDKGQAMRLLGKELDINSDQMMAFGDTYNDIEMLRAVKYSYIVANANDDMRQYADYVTKSNDEYGVTLVLEKLIQIIKKERHLE